MSDVVGQADEGTHNQIVHGRQEKQGQGQGDRQTQGGGEMAQATVADAILAQGGGGAEQHNHRRFGDQGKGEGDAVGSEIDGFGPHPGDNGGNKRTFDGHHQPGGG